MFEFSFKGVKNASNFIAGIDEAGRGPVIGPLIVCAATSSKNEEELAKIGVRDSKVLLPAKRESLFSELQNFCSFYFVILSAKELNVLMDKKSLNQIEAEAMVELMKKSKTKETIIDMPDRSLETFSKRLTDLGISKSSFKASHKADQLFPIVSTASIGAKSVRELEIEKIKKDIGFDFGSGYPADPKTEKVLSDPEKRSKLQKYLRTKWKTLDKYSQDYKQKNLSDF